MAAARKSTMTAEHKRALAQGRAEGRAVRAYLEALDQNRPRRGRPRTPASIEKRLKAVESELADAAPLHRLQLVQERMDLERELDRFDAADDLTGLERDFVKVARGYAERKASRTRPGASSVSLPRCFAKRVFRAGARRPRRPRRRLREATAAARHRRWSREGRLRRAPGAA